MFSNKKPVYWSSNYKIQNATKSVIFHLLTTYRSTNIITDELFDANIHRYDDWNMAQHVGDDAELVQENRKLLNNVLQEQFSLDCTKKPILWLLQTHSANVIEYNNEVQNLKSTQGVDGIFTLQEKSPCCVMTADCVPIFLWNEDIENPAVCMLHAGWQGILNGIIESGVSELKQKIEKTNKNNNLKAFIGVHLTQDYFEVGFDVFQRFENYINQKREEFGITDSLKYYYSNQEDEEELLDTFSLSQAKYYINLALVCNFILQLESVKTIEFHDDCTYQQEDLYYSHRRQTHQTPHNAMTGRMAHLIWFEIV